MVAGKRSKNTYQTVSLVILATKGNLGQWNQGRSGKNKTSENHISTTTFILQHHLQHLIIGFGMSSKYSFPHNTLLSPPIINASRSTSSHTLRAAIFKARSTISTGQSNLSATRFACGRIGHWRSNCPCGRNFRR